MFQQQTPLLVAVNIVLIFLLYYLTKPALANEELTVFKRRMVLIISFAFCIFSFWGADWFHYNILFDEVKSGSMYSHFEDVYIWLIERVSGYYIFRIIIWGAALFFYYRTLKLLDINIDLALFFFCSIYLIWFSYARVSLSISLMFYGVTLVLISRNFSLVKLLLGFFFIIVSFFFHKSAPFGIAVVVFALLLQRGAKFTTTIALITFPLIVFLVSSYFGEGMSMLMAGEDSTLGEYATQGNRYLEAETGFRGMGIRVVSLFEKIPYYLLALLCIMEVFGKKQLDKAKRYYYLVTILFVLVSSVFLFNIGVSGRVTYVRFIRYTQIPASISLVYLFENNNYPRLFRYTYIIGIIGAFVNLFYVLYCSIVG